jgi:hypothetical protein
MEIGPSASGCRHPPGRSTLARAGRRSASVLGRPRHQRENEHGTEHDRNDCDGVVHPARVARRNGPALNAGSSGALRQRLAGPSRTGKTDRLLPIARRLNGPAHVIGRLSQTKFPASEMVAHRNGPRNEGPGVASGRAGFRCSSYGRVSRGSKRGLAAPVSGLSRSSQIASKVARTRTVRLTRRPRPPRVILPVSMAWFRGCREAGARAGWRSTARTRLRDCLCAFPPGPRPTRFV